MGAGFPSHRRFYGPRPITCEELADVDTVISKDGCGQAMANALEATSARKAAGQAANNLSYKTSTSLHLSVQIWLRSSCRACTRAKNETMVCLRECNAPWPTINIPQLSSALLAHVRYGENGDDEEIARAT